jgi:nucleotide-binding universal stress UspA family protein
LIQVNDADRISWYCQFRRAEESLFRHILVPATGSDNDAPVFAAALEIGRVSGSHLQFLHVRADVRQTLVAMSSGHVIGGGAVGYYRILDALEYRVAERHRNAELAFGEFCDREQLLVSSDPSAGLPSAEWSVEIGEEPAWLAKYGRAADLLVIGRAREGKTVAMDVLAAGLMQTGRPMLIVPAKPLDHRSGIVAIAWKNRPEAARAVAAAQPLLAMAKEVVIFCVDEGAQDDERSRERLRLALSWHNAHTTVRTLEQDAGSPVETVLAAAGAARADLLVMGGYGHSRIQEVLFGGFTRHVLLGADLPILMAH